MAVIRVGTNKDYTNINTAIGAGSEGDLILIDPGDYSTQGIINVTKPVNLVGDTRDVAGNRVTLQRLHFQSCTPIKTLKVVAENLYIHYTAGDYALYSSAAWPKDVEVVFNKCSVIVANTGTYIGYWHSDSYATFINCIFSNQYYYNSGDSADIPSKWSTIRHQVSSSTNFRDLTYQDYVIGTADIYGYGYNYGYSYFKLPSKYYFQGTVTEQLVPVARTIKAYRRDNDVMMSQTTSNVTTGAYRLVTEYSGEHYLICRDDAVGGQYNDLVRALVSPAIEDYEENQWSHSAKYTLTIDHTLVDEDLFDFPLLINLNTACGLNNFNAEDIFANLTTFASRWSLQTEDNQQLYVEITKWDHSNREAIAWAQVPLIKSSEDTVLILRYDILLPNNVFNVVASSNRLAVHLWGRTCLGTWHMTEDPGDVNDVRDSSYWSHHGTPYDLGSTTHIDADLGKAIDFSSGYLKMPGLNDILTTNMTLFAVVKFDDINTRGTIFKEGAIDAGWEVGVDNGKLFSCVSTADNYHSEVSTTLSGIDTSKGHIVTALIDTAGDKIELFLADTSVDSRSGAIASFIGTDGDTIGSSYLTSPYDPVDIPGVTYNPLVHIVSVSGTVVSGTVFSLHTDGTSYYDLTGRHTLVPKRPSDASILTDYKKAGNGTVRNLQGTLDSDPINEYNYIKINDNDADFGFIEGQDFTVSCWLKTSFAGTATNYRVSIIGDANGTADTCMSLRKDYHRTVSNNYWHYSVNYELTIPNVSGGFVVKNERMYQYSYDSGSADTTHVALVRYNGAISFYINGQEKYNIYHPGEIPSPVTVSGSMATSVFSVDDTIPYSESYYADINNLEIIKGYARWSGDFTITQPPKIEPDTFFSGQIDEVMLYSEVKTNAYIAVFNKSVRDELITYT